MKIKLILAIVMSISLIGCSTNLTKDRGEPEWVSSPQLGGEKMFGSEAFYGLGKSTVSDLDVAMSESADEARTQVAAAINSKVEKISEKMQDVSFTSLGQGPSEKLKTNVSENIKKKYKNSLTNIVKVVLNGSTVMKSWRDESKNFTFTLAKIDRKQAELAITQEFTRMVADAVKNADEKKISEVVQGIVEKNL